MSESHHHQPDVPDADQPDAEPEPAPQPMGPLGPDQSSLLRVLSESEVPEDLTAWSSETNQDHILGKMTDAEIWERKFNIENNREFVEAMFPPEESILQGEFRKEFFGGLPGGNQPLDARRLHELSDSVDAAYARSTRSRDGWQQEQFSKQIQEMIRRDAGDSGGAPAGGNGGSGIISRFLGGGR